MSQIDATTLMNIPIGIRSLLIAHSNYLVPLWAALINGMIKLMIKCKYCTFEVLLPLWATSIVRTYKSQPFTIVPSSTIFTEFSKCCKSIKVFIWNGISAEPRRKSAQKCIEKSILHTEFCRLVSFVVYVCVQLSASDSLSEISPRVASTAVLAQPHLIIMLIERNRDNILFHQKFVYRSWSYNISLRRDAFKHCIPLD